MIDNVCSNFMFPHLSYSVHMFALSTSYIINNNRHHRFINCRPIFLKLHFDVIKCISYRYWWLVVRIYSDVILNWLCLFVSLFLFIMLGFVLGRFLVLILLLLLCFMLLAFLCYYCVIVVCASSTIFIINNNNKQVPIELVN